MLLDFAQCYNDFIFFFLPFPPLLPYNKPWVGGWVRGWVGGWVGAYFLLRLTSFF